MSTNENPEKVTSESETSQEDIPGTAQAESAEEASTGPKCSWEQKEGFKIAHMMRDLIHQTIEASTSEIDSLRKKLEKLTYGG